MKKHNILCVGGDARSIYMCEYLASTQRVYAYKTKAKPNGAVWLESLKAMSERADVLVLPMLNSLSYADGEPYIEGVAELRELLPLLESNALVTGGLPGSETVEYFRRHGFELIDYFKCPDLIVKNCIPTAEGALLIAMQEQATTVFGAKVLITGFGNVAKACARLFSAAGAEVTCAVRRADARAEVYSAGYNAADTAGLAEIIADHELIINTAPALLFDRPLLEKAGSKALIIDLASLPGGVDLKAADELKVRHIHALGLPGKVAPVTAGRYIAETVINIMSERRI